MCPCSNPYMVYYRRPYGKSRSFKERGKWYYGWYQGCRPWFPMGNKMGDWPKKILFLLDNELARLVKCPRITQGGYQQLINLRTAGYIKGEGRKIRNWELTKEGKIYVSLLEKKLDVIKELNSLVRKEDYKGLSLKLKELGLLKLKEIQFPYVTARRLMQRRDK